MRNYISIFFLFGLVNIQAQVVSNLGRFSIEYDQGCNPSTVHITRLDTFGNVSRQYFFGADNAGILDTFYTYNNPGKYEIVQFVGEDVEPKSDTLIFTILDSPIPIFDLFNCSDSTFNISLSSNNYDYYNLTTTDTSITTEPTAISLLRQTAATINVKGFFNEAFNDGCPSVTKSIPDHKIYTEPRIDSLSLVEACKNQFLFSLNGDFDEFTKYRLSYSLDSASAFKNFYEGAVTDSFSTLIPLENSEFNDFCILVEVLNACSFTVENKKETCTIPRKHINDLEKIYASYSGENIVLELPDSEWTYVIARSANKGEMHFLDSVRTRFLDTNIFGQRKYEYQIEKIDTCTNTLWSVNIAPPFQTIISKNTEENILFTEQSRPLFSGSLVDSITLIYNSDSTGFVNTPYSKNIILDASLGEIQSFRQEYVTGSNKSIYSNELKSTFKFKVNAPNAFTPNNDGLNDVFLFYGLPQLDGTLFIFDRWGRNIYKSNQPDSGWNGYAENEIAPAGTYRYKIQFVIDGQIQEQVGSFVLIIK
ncbi:MAG: gliding motility-associated C-terminal domain-containing protein [Cyclobacteriaceae bacterium]